MELREQKKEAYERFVILIMRSGLEDKIWWTFEELSKEMGLTGPYVSALTKSMRNRGVLIERDQKPILVKLNEKLAVSLPKGKDGVSYFGPVPETLAQDAIKQATADGVSSTTWFGRAVKAYAERRARILSEW